MSKFSKIFANTFILVVLLMMLKPHLPVNNKFISFLYYPVNKIEASIGTNQTWFMFSPPSRLDSYVVGEVFYGDGSQDSFDFYKPLGMNMLDKYLYGEKYRKYVSEHLRIDKRKFLWRDGAYFAVRKLNEKNKGKRPVKVTLTRFWSETPDWRRYFIKHSENKPKYSHYLFYSEEIP